MDRILVLANHYNTLRIFRRELLIRLAADGHDVMVAIPECSEENRSILESYGCKVLFVPVDRRGMNPLKDLSLFFTYLKLIRRYRPNKVLTYTIKCNIYGAFACRIKGIPCFVNITGLGSAFETPGKTKQLVSFMYKHSLKRAGIVFFENEGNRNTLVNEKIVRMNQTVVLPGAGVNLKEFALAEYPEDQTEIRFLFIGRIMKEKGVNELFDAIQVLCQNYPNVHFDFIGWFEEEYKDIVEALEKKGYIRFWGFQQDVRPFIERAHCVILPSWHEGMSNTLLEGAAMGRPLITSNVHGCMEAVEDGVTGFLTEVGNAEDILKKLETFLQLSGSEKRKMGLAGRARMELLFDKNEVVRRTLSEIFDNSEA